MKRILVCLAVVIVTAWISAAVFAADAPKAGEPNRAMLPDRHRQPPASSFQKAQEERVAELKQIQAIAKEEKAEKTAAAIDKLIAKEQAQLDKMKEREKMMQERLQQMKEKRPPVTPAPVK